MEVKSRANLNMAGSSSEKHESIDTITSQPGTNSDEEKEAQRKTEELKRNLKQMDERTQARLIKNAIKSR